METATPKAAPMMQYQSSSPGGTGAQPSAPLQLQPQQNGQAPAPAPGAFSGLDPSIYTAHTLRSHILAIPDTYVGSMVPESRREWLLNTADGKMNAYEFQICAPIERLFIEGLSNAADNADRSWRKGINPGTIEVDVNTDTVRIKNGGIPIPVAKHPSGLWTPEFIFGQLLTSSNYNPTVQRTGNGRNGYGAKLILIFSEFFMIEIVDCYNGLSYKQIWRKNMDVREQPTITQLPPGTTESSVTITYKLDFEYFKRMGVPEYSDVLRSLFASHTANVSLTCKVPARFNNLQLDVRDIRSYAKLLFPEAVVETAYLHVQDDHKGGNYAPTMEALVLDTPRAGRTIAFNNGILNLRGGTHLRGVNAAVCKLVLDNLHGAKPKDDKMPRLSARDIERHISIIVNCHLPDPTYDGQSKHELRSPAIEVKLSDKFLKAISSWQLRGCLLAEVEAMKKDMIKKKEGKRRWDEMHYEDANDAGKAGKREGTILFLVEGNSAMNNVIKMASMIPHGRDKIGIFPFRGKIINAMAASLSQLADNKELNCFKDVWGLREFTTDLAEFDRYRRYDYVAMNFDADYDGTHIGSLLINYLHCRHPLVLTQGRLLLERQPILRAFRGNDRYRFYSEAEFKAFERAVDEKNGPGAMQREFTIKYYKGLATSNDSDIADDVANRRVVFMIYDDKAPEEIKRAFDATMSNARKAWIANWQPTVETEIFQKLPISMFISEECVRYGRHSLERAIPSTADGVKVGQRKTIWTLLKKRFPRTVKVARLVSMVDDYTTYHHGPKALEDTINCMAADFVGSNNLPYLIQDGQFGTRREGGKDVAAARYPRTGPARWLPFMYRKEDEPILIQQVDEGEVIQPKFLLPILPMHLINGANGIASGWSTFIPNYAIADVHGWMVRRCQWDLEEQKGPPQLPTIKPHYNGFKGEIKVVAHEVKSIKAGDDRTFLPFGQPAGPLPEPQNFQELAPPLLAGEHAGVVMPDANDEDEESAAPTAHAPVIPTFTPGPLDAKDAGTVIPLKLVRYSMETRGLVRYQQGNYIVEELPIGRWTVPYLSWLKGLVAEKRIKSIRDHSSATTVKIEIHGSTFPLNDDSLRLTRSYGISNMRLLDPNGRIVHFPTVDHLLEHFYLFRLEWYGKRRTSMLGSMQTTIEQKQLRLRFVELVKAKQIDLDWPADRVTKAMADHGMPDKFLDMKVRSITPKGIEKLKAEIDALKQERAALEQKKPQQLWLADLEEFAAKVMAKLK